MSMKKVFVISVPSSCICEQQNCGLEESFDNLADMRRLGSELRLRLPSFAKYTCWPWLFLILYLFAISNEVITENKHSN